MVDASQSFHFFERLSSYKSPALVMFVCLLAFQPWRRRLARRRPRTGRQRRGGGRHEVGRRRFDLHPAGSRGGIDRRLPVHPEYPTGGSIGGAQRGRPVVDFTLLRTSAPGIRRSQAIWCPVVPCVAGLRAALRFKGRCFGRPQNVDGHITARFNLVACITACLLARWRAVVALDGRPRLHNAREQERRNRRRLHNKYMRAHQNGQRTCTVPQYYSIHATTI